MGGRDRFDSAILCRYHERFEAPPRFPIVPVPRTGPRVFDGRDVKMEPVYSFCLYGALIAGMVFAVRRRWRRALCCLLVGILSLLAPAGEFVERHEITVNASRERTWAAVMETTANEIFLFQTLTTIRRGGRSGPESILNAPEHQPILDVATRTTFKKLAEIPGREIVVGTYVVGPKRALAKMNFVVDEVQPGVCRVRTETRVEAYDDLARRSFARYWRAIYPGSSAMRFFWLRAIRARAERSGAGSPMAFRGTTASNERKGPSTVRLSQFDDAPSGVAATRGLRDAGC